MNKQIQKSVEKIYKLLQKSPSILLKGEKHGKIIYHKDVLKLIDLLEDIEDYNKIS
jgi:predicted transcriptional regulator